MEHVKGLLGLAILLAALVAVKAMFIPTPGVNPVSEWLIVFACVAAVTTFARLIDFMRAAYRSNVERSRSLIGMVVRGAAATIALLLWLALAFDGDAPPQERLQDSPFENAHPDRLRR